MIHLDYQVKGVRALKKQVNMRLEERHIDLMDEIIEVYKHFDLKYSKADIVQMALESLLGKSAMIQDRLIDNVHFRGNVDLETFGIKR